LIVTLLIISGTILLFLGVNALQRRDMPAARAFALTMFSASLWSFGFAAEVVSPSLQGKIFWADIQFLGINILPLSWFAMTLYYTGQPRWTIRSLSILGLVPLATMLVIWSDPYHHLFRGSPSLDIINLSFSVLNNDYGIFYYAVAVPFSYFLFAISLILLGRFWLKSSEIYRRQGLILFLSLLLPLVVDVLYVLDITPIPKFNFAAITFSFSGLLVSWNIFSLRFLDITPLANDVVISTMQVGVIVLDKQGRITDINPEAEKITGVLAIQNIGLPAAQVFPDYASFLNTDSDEEGEIVLEQDGEKYHYAARNSLVLGVRKRVLGRVITLNNISERVKLFQQVKEASMTDSLTGVSNRRAFIKQGETEITRTLRHKKHLSVIMMDIDDFKSINDEMGHKYGDEALITVAHLCRQQMRSSDEIARYGGDEFIILLPETSAEDAFTLAERICRDVAHTNCVTESGETCSISISLGVTEFDRKETLGSLLHRADKALYKAKNAGKGQVVLI
ncbi:MAG: diguanylate cyclase, partial [Anaerolineae bacterium]|nr:diguanylate cyclase [Anaerolineae bacterium]